MSDPKIIEEVIQAHVMLCRLMPEAEVRDRYPYKAQSHSWCKATHPKLPSSMGSKYVWCTRSKGHVGPHIDYIVGGMGLPEKVDYLIWENESEPSHR